MEIETCLQFGGIAALGFSPNLQFLLVGSYSGRGVFSTESWERVARDDELSYPEDGHAIGIGPLNGERIPVTEMNYDTGELTLISPDGQMK